MEVEDCFRVKRERFNPVFSTFNSKPRPESGPDLFYVPCSLDSGPLLRSMEDAPVSCVAGFRRGLVFKARRLLYHSILGLRVIKKKKKRRGRVCC